MAKPIPVAIRGQIIERHQAGEKLTQIAHELGMAYESVRKVWRVYRTEGRVEPNYGACGPQGVKASQRVYRGALWLKRLHPTWGATLIRQVLVEKWPQESMPHERSLQRWFQAARLKAAKPKVTGEARLGRGRAAHNVWEMDSKEGVVLASGEKVSWVLVSDEASGAVLSGHVFPLPQSQPDQPGASS